MNAHWLDARIAAARLRPLSWLAIGFLLLAAIAQAWVLPELRAQRDGLQRELDQHLSVTASARKARARAVPVANAGLDAFVSNLGERNYQEEQVRTLFALAAQSGLTLSEATYSASNDPSGIYQTFEVAMPLQGTFASIESFCEGVLLAVPFAALDTLQIKREGVGASTVQAKVHFSFFLRPSLNGRQAVQAPAASGGVAK